MTDTITAGPGGTAPPPGGTPPDKHWLVGHADAVTKLSGVVLGALFVLGIVISNVQLMDLGISDFASLQARNILTGFVFVVYFAVMLLMLLLAYVIIAALVYLATMAVTGRDIEILSVPFLRHFHTRGLRATFSAGTAVISAAVLFLAATIIGQYFDYVLYPWGEVGLFEFGATLSRFRNAYLSGNNLTAIGLVLAATIFYFVMKWTQEEDDEQHPILRFWDRIPLGFGFLYCAVALSIVLAGYANNIYPNLRYNLGGGQPQIAKLVFSGKKSDIAAAGAFGVPHTELCCNDAGSEQAIKSDQLVIWYQSDKFVYASSLTDLGPNSPRAQVIAADLKLIRDIQYLPRYVQIHDGNRILQIYERKPNDTIVPVPTPPARAAAPATGKPIIWAQLRPDGDDVAGWGQLIARAVVDDGGACPKATLVSPTSDARTERAMTERWFRTDGPFPVKICEVSYAGNLTATIGDAILKPRPAEANKIIVIGDTGCRIAKWGMQDCNDPDEWPFQKIAAKAAAHNPDLIIHVGDYQYREACLAADAGKCAGLALGDVWPAWRKDFFEPAGKLLAAAPWVMLRGNHEDMARAGAGWLRLFAPFPSEVPLPDDVRPYLLRFGGLTLAVLDVANEGEAAAALVRGELYGRWMRRLARRLPSDPARQNWLFLHKPLWASYGCANCSQAPDPDDTINSVRERLRNGPARFDLVVAGDTHMFQFFVPHEDKLPPQLIAGMSGTLLEAERAYPAAALDKTVGANLFGVDGRLWMHHGFGYLVLTKQAAGWSAALYGPDGDKPVVTCNLAAGDRTRTDLPCH